MLGRVEPFFTLALVAALIGAAGACDTREGQARETGRKGRSEVARVCPKDAGDGCVRSACQAVCAPVEYDVPHQRCEEACLGNGSCDRDDDCLPPLRCIAIAPVVRRCGSLSDAGPSPSPQ